MPRSWSTYAPACRNNTITTLHAKALAELLNVDRVSAGRDSGRASSGGCTSVCNSVVHFTIRGTAMGLDVPDDYVFEQNSSPRMGGLVMERTSVFEKEMRDMLVEKTSPGLGGAGELLQKSEDAAENEDRF